MHVSCERCLRVLLLWLLAGCGAACGAVRVPLVPADDRDQTLELPPATEPLTEAPLVIPTGGDADWLQLESGEWLRGKLVRVRDEKVTFDSEVLDELELDLDDVRTIRTAGPEVVVTDAGLTLRGRLVLEGDTLWIEGARTVQLAREEVFATFAFEDGTAEDWEGNVSLGVTTRSGNTDQTDATALAEALRETARTRWRTVYNGTLTRAEGSEIANNHRLRSVHDVYLSPRVFLTAPSLEVFRDRFQNIEVRVTPTAALGYELIDRPDQSWRLSLGPGYQYTRFTEPAPGIGEDDSTLAAVLLSQYTWDVTSRIDLGFDYSITAALPETDDYSHNLLLRLSVDLIGDFTLDVSFVWDRVNQPIPDAGGSVPEEDDYRTTVGLGWSF